MKIVHVWWSLTFGGVDTILVNIANEQAKDGHEVSVVLINKLYEQSLVEAIDKRVKYMSTGRKPGSRSPMFLFRLNRKLLQLEPDVVHLHWSGFYGFLLSKRLRCVAYSTLHALPQGEIRHKSLFGSIPLWNAVRCSGILTLIDQVPKVFAISNAVHDELLGKYGVESSVVNNGIITKNFKKRNANMPNGKFRIVQVGRLDHDKKGQDLLIHAVAKLKDIMNLEVNFIGDGKSMEYLKSLTQELVISDWINFLGKHSQNYIAKHLGDYDLFVQPSRYEGFGLTVAEAMAARVPILVSAGQGPAEVCCGNTYGWLFENGNVDDLVDKIVHIYNHYTDALEKAGRGQSYVYDNYDVSVTARKYIENYKMGDIKKGNDTSKKEY